MAYGPNIASMYRQSAQYVDRILKGARPADLPVGSPAQFEFVINAGTAKSIGAALPSPLLNRATAVLP
jgi:putative ABC transport system substrate-binding protein